MVDRVVVVPRHLIRAGPFLARHLRVRGGDVIEVVAVEVLVHRHAGLEQLLVVLGARQRREIEKFEQIDRQLLLDHLDIVGDQLLGVVRKAQDVAGISDDVGLLPGQQHLAVFGDLVLPLLGRHQVGRIDILKPDEDAADARALALLDEVRQLVAERVDLDDQREVNLLDLAQMDQPVEDLLPVLVAGEVVVGDEKSEQPLPDVDPDDLLDVVGGAAARFAPLHVDDGAERALVGTAAAGVEARHRACGAPHALALEQRDRRALDAEGRSFMKL